MGDEADLGDLTWGQASRLCRARCCEPRRAVKRAFSKGGDRGGALHACLLACQCWRAQLQGVGKRRGRVPVPVPAGPISVRTTQTA